jgi:hypothetical protein
MAKGKRLIFSKGRIWMKKVKIFASVLACLILIASAALGQIVTSKIIGKVTDAEGTPLPGVDVEATSPALVGKATAFTDAGGSYRFLSLVPGTYKLTFILAGFKSLVRENVPVALGQTLNFNVTMELGKIEESITVVGQSPLIDIKSTVKGQVMTKEVFAFLPKARNFDALVSTVPGVQYDRNTGGLSVDGATGPENQWYIDGTDVTNIHVGNLSQNAVYEFVEEIKVTATGYPAEFGGSMGGVVNVVTRSGGNAYHGDVIAYYNNNNKWMLGHARDYLRISPTNDYVAEYANDEDLYGRDPNYRVEGVFSLGGYIIKDRVWFFGSFDPVFNQTRAQRMFLSDPTPRQYSTYVARNWNDNFQVKLTAAPIKGLRISASAVNNFYKYRGALPNITGSSTKSYDYYKEGYDYPNFSANGSADYSLGNNLLFSLRGGYFMTNQNNQQIYMPTTRYAFTYGNTTIAGIPASLQHVRNWTNWAGGTTQMKNLERRRVNVSFDTNYYMDLYGQHSLKFGVLWERQLEDYDNSVQHPLVALNWGVSYTMPDGTVVNGTYGHYQIRGSWTSPYGYYWNIHRDRWAIYLQDSWTIRNKLTLNFGLRTESEYIPSFSTLDPTMAAKKPIVFNFGDKLAPRFGAIYDVFGDSSLKVYGSFGIYYDVMKLYMAEGAYGGFKWKTDYYYLDDYDWTKIAATGVINDRASQTAGNRYGGTRDWRSVSWDTTNPDMKPVAQRDFQFGVEKKLTEELLAYVRFTQRHLIRTIEDIGILIQTGPTEISEVYYLDNPGMGWVRPVSQGGQFPNTTAAGNTYWPEPKAKREYYSVNIGIDKRFSNNWQGGFNYTWSRLVGNIGGLASPEEAGRVSPNVERYFDGWFLMYDIHGNLDDGVLADDRTHYIKAYGSYSFPFGLSVGIVGYGRSGLPVTTELGFRDMQGYYPENHFNFIDTDYAGIMAGKTSTASVIQKRLPFTAWADLYLEYNLKLAEKYNVQLNLTVFNFTNTKTAQFIYQIMNRNTMQPTDDQILTKTYDYKADVVNWNPDPRYGKVTDYYGPWSVRLGAKLSF